MSEMVERLAAIIADGVYEDIASRVIAERVIAAMREPTEAMRTAADSPGVFTGEGVELMRISDVSDPAGRIWRASIIVGGSDLSWIDPASVTVSTTQESSSDR